MGIKSSRQRGRRRVATYRVGPGFQIGGMYLEGDPGSNPPNRPRHLENVRFVGGVLRPRGGMRKFNDTALDDTDACIRSIEDHQTDPFRLYVAYDGCPGISSSVGFSVLWLDPDQNPELQRGVYKDGASNTMVLAPYDGSLYLGIDDQLRRFIIVVAPFGTESLGIGGVQQDIPLATFTGFNVNCMIEFDGKLFIGLANGASSKIVTWDGLTVRDDLTGINPPTAFGVWRDKLVVGFAAASNQIRYRAVGSSPGTWSTVAPGVGTVESVQIVSYKDIAYITDAAANVWSYDGTTLAIARTVVGSQMHGLATFNGYLFYGYQSAGSQAILGRFDGSSWVDAHKNFTTQPLAGTLLPRRLKEYRGALWAGVNKGASGGDIYRSPQTDTAGTWVDKMTFSSLVGDVNEMVTF